jgi:hypothetical protein
LVRGAGFSETIVKGHSYQKRTSDDLGRKAKIDLSGQKIFNPRECNQQQEDVGYHHPHGQHESYEPSVFNAILNNRKHHRTQAEAKGNSDEQPFEDGLEIKPTLTHAAGIGKKMS